MTAIHPNQLRSVQAKLTLAMQLAEARLKEAEAALASELMPLRINMRSAQRAQESWRRALEEALSELQDLRSAVHQPGESNADLPRQLEMASRKEREASSWYHHYRLVALESKDNFNACDAKLAPARALVSQLQTARDHLRGACTISIAVTALELAIPLAEAQLKEAEQAVSNELDDLRWMLERTQGLQQSWQLRAERCAARLNRLRDSGSIRPGLPSRTIERAERAVRQARRQFHNYSLKVLDRQDEYAQCDARLDPARTLVSQIRESLAQLRALASR